MKKLKFLAVTIKEIPAQGGKRMLPMKPGEVFDCDDSFALDLLEKYPSDLQEVSGAKAESTKMMLKTVQFKSK